MRRLSLMVSVILALSILTVASGWGGEAGKSDFVGFFKINSWHSTFEVNPDGSYAEYTEVLMEALTEEGVKLVNTANITYSESLQEVKLLSASTLKKDGRRIEVPAANIQDRAAVAGGGPVFSDIKAKNIIFADVAQGDKVSYSYRMVQKVPVFPGHFSLGRYFSRFVVYDDASLRVSVPEGLPLAVFASEVGGGAVSRKGGRKEWVWTYRSARIELPEEGSVAESDNGPRIYASSFKDYGAVAAAYRERAKARSAVTEKVGALAEELTRGVADRREQATRLYNWVTQNIAYAGNVNGIGSVVPHDADTVLANRLGDCKDHAALLEALLQAKGIASSAVLVSSGDSYKLAEVPVPGVLNHVITYVPSLDVYLDSTAERMPFGMLPISVAGKPVVRVDGYRDGEKTPQVDYLANTSTMKMTLNIHEDGTADGETSNVETGHEAVAIRNGFLNLRPDIEDLVARKIIASRGYTGTGSFIKSDSRELSDSFSYGLKYHLSDVVNIPGPGAMKLSPILPGGAATEATANSFSEPERKTDYGCIGHVSTEEYLIRFPTSVRVLAVPRAVRKGNDIARYESSYRLDGNTVTAVRKFFSMEPGGVCTPDQYKRFRTIVLDMMKDLKAQIMYAPAEEADPAEVPADRSEPKAEPVVKR